MTESSGPQRCHERGLQADRDAAASTGTASLAARVPRELFMRDLPRCLRAIAGVWAGILLAWAAVGVFGVWALLPAAVLIGTLQYQLNVMGHDGLHYLLSHNRVANDRVCRWLLHGPHGAPLGSMRRNHLSHHTAFGGASDLDRQYYDTRRFASGAAFTRWLWGSLAGGMTGPIVAKLLGLGGHNPAAETGQRAARVLPAPGRALDLLSVLLSQAWIAVVCALITGWWFAYLPLWALPLVTVMMGLNSIRSCLEHARAGHGEPGLHSFKSNPLERFFLSPFHMNVHAEHHLVPAVPWHQLLALRQHLQNVGDYERVTLFESYSERAAQLAGLITSAPQEPGPDPRLS